MIVFKGSIRSCMRRVFSDHVPLLLDCDEVAKGKSPFRFENMWLKESGFLKWVSSKWSSYVIVGDPCFKIAKKLKLLKDALKE